jgi:hypothetical protein
MQKRGSCGSVQKINAHNNSGFSSKKLATIGNHQNFGLAWVSYVWTKPKLVGGFNHLEKY